jgi:hypothetical protein
MAGILGEATRIAERLANQLVGAFQERSRGGLS